jgi:hypothetical protein
MASCRQAFAFTAFASVSASASGLLLWSFPGSMKACWLKIVAFSTDIALEERSTTRGRLEREINPSKLDRAAVDEDEEDDTNRFRN